MAAISNATKCPEVPSPRIGEQLTQAAPRIEQRVLLRAFGRPSSALISGPYCFTQLPVSGSCTSVLHPWMLIRGHRLAGELTTQPAPGLGQHHLATKVAGSQCSRQAAAATSNNQHIAGQLHESP